MNYELAKELKDAGFPTDWCGQKMCDQKDCNGGCPYPTLEELIAACPKELEQDEEGWGQHPFSLIWHDNKWIAAYILIDDSNFLEAEGDIPSTAVARLWLELNKKQ